MSNSKVIDNKNPILSTYEKDSLLNVSDIQEENSYSEALKNYTCKIIDSLKNSINYSVNSETLANQSIFDLCAQNEQLNRVKRDLNESHDKLSITEKLVDRYVSAIGWISSTMKWDNSVKLDIEESNDKFKQIGCNNPTSCSCNNTEESCNISIKSDDLVSDLFNHTTQGLSTLINNFKNNRVKTDLISSIILHQNNELEKISSSANSLKERVSAMNKVLKS